MKKFVIERTLPGAGNLSAEELQSIAETSCEVVNQIGKPYHWMQSFVPGIKFTAFTLLKVKRWFANMRGCANFLLIQ